VFPGGYIKKKSNNAGAYANNPQQFIKEFQPIWGLGDAWIAMEPAKKPAGCLGNNTCQRGYDQRRTRFFFVMILSYPPNFFSCHPKRNYFKRKFHLPSNHHFSGDMLIFRGGTLRICFENIVTYGLYRFPDCKIMSCKHSFV